MSNARKLWEVIQTRGARRTIGRMLFLGAQGVCHPFSYAASVDASEEGMLLVEAFAEGGGRNAPTLPTIRFAREDMALVGFRADHQLLFGHAVILLAPVLSSESVAGALQAARLIRGRRLRVDHFVALLNMGNGKDELELLRNSIRHHIFPLESILC